MRRELDCAKLRFERAKVLDENKVVVVGHIGPNFVQLHARRLLHDDVFGSHGIGSIGVPGQDRGYWHLGVLADLLMQA